LHIQLQLFVTAVHNKRMYISHEHTLMRKSTSSPRTATIRWLQHVYSRPVFRWAILTRTIGHTGLVWVCD